jgi:predicted negative regulator of RcsB-dependent stress response
LEEAEKTVSEAARLSKRSATILEHLGDVRMKLGKTREAQAAWKEAAKLLEDDSGQKLRIMSKLNKASNK